MITKFTSAKNRKKREEQNEGRWGEEMEETELKEGGWKGDKGRVRGSVAETQRRGQGWVRVSSLGRPKAYLAPGMAEVFNSGRGCVTEQTDSATQDVCTNLNRVTWKKEKGVGAVGGPVAGWGWHHGPDLLRVIPAAPPCVPSLLKENQSCCCTCFPRLGLSGQPPPRQPFGPCLHWGPFDWWLVLVGKEVSCQGWEGAGWPEGLVPCLSFLSCHGELQGWGCRLCQWVEGRIR